MEIMDSVKPVCISGYSQFFLESRSRKINFLKIFGQFLGFFTAKFYIRTDLGRIGGGGRLPFSGTRPPADPKGPSLYFFQISIFGNGP